MPAGARARGVISGEGALVLAGLDVAVEAFRQLEPGVRREVRRGDGAHVQAGEKVGRGHRPRARAADGRAHGAQLPAAAVWHRHADAPHSSTRPAGRITMLDTRKTTPTLRVLEKHAVRCGGGTNHRCGLYDAILIKDNHMRLAGGVRRRSRGARGAGPDCGSRSRRRRSPSSMRRSPAARAIVLRGQHDDWTTCARPCARVAGRAKIEISGGVTLERMPELAATGADYVSAGALTHSAPAVDISFELEPI